MPGSVCVGVAAMIFNEEGKMLLLKRTGSHGEGQWAPPGGWVDKGEFLTEAAQREVEEETGLKVSAWNAFDYTEDFHPEGVHDICFWIRCEIRADGPQAPLIREPEKATELRWFSYEEIDQMHHGELFMPLSLFRDLDYLQKAFEEFGVPA